MPGRALPPPKSTPLMPAPPTPHSPPSHMRPAVLPVLHKARPRKLLVRLLGAPAVCIGGQDGGMSLCKGHAGAAAASAASSSCASVCAPAAAPSAGGQATARLGLCWPGSSCCQYACTGRESAPAAVWVGVHRQAPRIHGMQQRREDGPGSTQLIPAQLVRQGRSASVGAEGGRAAAFLWQQPRQQGTKQPGQTVLAHHASLAKGTHCTAFAALRRCECLPAHLRTKCCWSPRMASRMRRG